MNITRQELFELQTVEKYDQLQDQIEKLEKVVQLLSRRVVLLEEVYHDAAEEDYGGHDMTEDS